jgi:hypothetical protein
MSQSDGTMLAIRHYSLSLSDKFNIHGNSSTTCYAKLVLITHLLLTIRLHCIFSALAQVCVEIFKEKGHQADVKNGLTVEQLHSIIGDYDGMVVRSATKVYSAAATMSCLTTSNAANACPLERLAIVQQVVCL